MSCHELNQAERAVHQLQDVAMLEPYGSALRQFGFTARAANDGEKSCRLRELGRSLCESGRRVLPTNSSYGALLYNSSPIHERFMVDLARHERRPEDCQRFSRFDEMRWNPPFFAWSGDGASLVALRLTQRQFWQLSEPPTENPIGGYDPGDDGHYMRLPISDFGLAAVRAADYGPTDAPHFRHAGRATPSSKEPVWPCRESVVGAMHMHVHVHVHVHLHLRIRIYVHTTRIGLASSRVRRGSHAPANTEPEREREPASDFCAGGVWCRHWCACHPGSFLRSIIDRVSINRLSETSVTCLSQSLSVCPSALLLP